MTTRYSAVVPYTPRQAPDHDIASTVSGFELETMDEDNQDSLSTASLPQHTPASSQAFLLGDLEDEHALTPEAMATRIEQLLEESELQAEELRRCHKKRKHEIEKK